MAQRRMFSKSITNSARFLKMPTDSQNLYFHLGMSADDDGIVEAYSVLKITGSNEDNLRVLVAKGLIKVLNDDLVAFITDWHEHNLIRADRKIDSIYKNLLLRIIPDAELMEPRPRGDTKKLTGQPMDDQWTTNGQHRLGKDRLGKDNKDLSDKSDLPEIIKKIAKQKVLTPEEKVRRDKFICRIQEEFKKLTGSDILLNGKEYNFIKLILKNSDDEIDKRLRRLRTLIPTSPNYLSMTPACLFSNWNKLLNIKQH